MKTLNTFKTVISAGIIAVLMSGCVTDSGTKTLAGGVVGAGLGGLLGSNVGGGRGKMAAIAAGTLAGALFGKSIGESLDRADQAHLGRAERRAETAPIGQTVSWSNPESGNGGRVTPTREGRNDQTGEYCREYQKLCL